jgi:hypothetical protein
MRRSIFLAAIAFLPVATLVRADDPPQAAKTILAKAIQAHGGEQALTKLMTATWSGRGLSYKKDDDQHAIAFYGEWMAALPNRYRYVYKFRGLGANLPVTTGLDGDKAWRSFSDARGGEDLVDQRLKEEQEEAHAVYLTRLVPLLQGDYKITTTPIGMREGRYVLGLKVERQGYKPNTLYFDRKVGYLTHHERAVFDVELGKDVVQVTMYQTFKPLGGAIQPQSHTIKRGGKLFMELEIDKIEPKTELEDKLFVKPVAKDKP